MDFSLFVTKSSDDALQIVEQILPFFQPDYTITLNDTPQWNYKRCSIILNGVSYEDSYDGDFTERKRTYTLTFTSKFYLYSYRPKVIKSVQVDQYTDMPVTPKREQRYTVAPTSKCRCR